MKDDVTDPTCASCGRRIEPRRAHRAGAPVVYCSARCRRRRLRPLDRRIEAELVALLERQRRGASVCPSEVARAVAPEGWRERMEDVRRAGRRLASRGRVELLQRGRRVDPSTAKGPIRIRRAEPAG